MYDKRMNLQPSFQYLCYRFLLIWVSVLYASMFYSVIQVFFKDCSEYFYAEKKKKLNS